MTFKRVIEKPEIDIFMVSFVKFLHRNFQHTSGSAVFNSGGYQFISGVEFSKLRELYQGSSGFHTILLGMILESCHQSEQVIPNSSTFVIRSILKLLGLADNPLQNYDTRDRVLASRKRATSRDISNFFKGITTDEKMHQLALHAVEMAGLEGTIFVDEKMGIETFVEAKSGYNFNILLPLGPYLHEKKWERHWCRCMVIDGVIEKVSEIDGILQQAAGSSTSLIIFARGFSAEVLNTLKVNLDRTTLDVLPVSFGVDNIEMINALADISHVLNVDPITPLKGDIISGRMLDDMNAVELIRCHGGTVTIINGSAESRIKNHVTELRRRRQLAHPDIALLLAKRIKSLSSACVTVKLGATTATSHQEQLEQIDILIRAAASILKLGMVDQKYLQKIMNEQDDYVLSVVGAEIMGLKDSIPTACVIGVYDSVNAFLANIKDIGVGILEDVNDGRC